MLEESESKVRTLPSAFADTVKRHGDRTALVEYQPIARRYTYKAYYVESVAVANALLGQGARPGDAAAILGSNSPSYLIAYWGALLAGLLPCGIYPTSSEASCRQLLQLARCVVAFGECGDCAARLVAAATSVGAPLRRLVVWSRVADESAEEPVIETYRRIDARVVSWRDFVAAGSSRDNGATYLTQPLGAQNPQQAAVLVFTSGTSGVPKAVMLSHKNILFIIDTAQKLIQFDETWRSVSYLPLSHVAATMLDIIGPALVGFELHFAAPDVLQPGSRSLVQTLQTVRPDFFVGVPRVWERIAEQLQRVGADRWPPLRWLSAWAKQVTLNEAQQWTYPQTEWRPGWRARIANWLVLWPIRRVLGLDRARLLISSAAPLGLETLDYFASLGMQICDLYGMSECTGPIAINLPWNYRRGTCGRALPGTHVRVDAVSGELQVQGQHVFLGYLGDPVSTAAAFTSDGFFRTGDLATIDADGFIRLTGRMKELLVTAGGENIAPLPLERALERAMPAVARAMLIGDRRKFLSCLLALHTAADNETLAHEAAQVDPSIRRADEASEAASVPGTPWHAYIERGLATANQEAVSRAAQIRKAWIVPRAFTVQDQTLTPTLKLRRSHIQALYAEQIDRLYQTG
ncbi:hypothetical protein CCYA_CCYA18G4502 [Cyanidiococcus yangmingshanensis]|nr:hypothetical protein CCYA_CCYA18G4502 [Cyanidiococcus yangmingshanensis]